VATRPSPAGVLTTDDYIRYTKKWINSVRRRRYVSGKEFDRLVSTCSLLVLSWASARAFQAKPFAQRTYSWMAELVATDTTAKTITIKPRMLPPPVPANAAQGEKDTARPSAPGGTPAPPAAPAVPPPLVLKTESDLLMSIDSSDRTKGTKIGTGFILPAEFVSADAQTVTVKLHVADTTLRAVASMQPGTWLRATSPMSQPAEEAVVSAVTTTSPPAAGTDTK
jgi:hypothetical protein